MKTTWTASLTPARVRRRLRSVCVILLMVLWLSESSFAQTAATRPAGSETAASSSQKTLQIEILIQSLPTYRVKAQEWGRAFQEIGYAPRFREATRGEKLRVEEVTTDGETTVLIVGGMSADGNIRVRGVSYAPTDIEALQAVLKKLERFGTSGPPETNPYWGFTEEQFLDVTKRLSTTVDKSVTLSTPLLTVESIGIPDGFRLTFSDAAYPISLQSRPSAAPEMLDLTGFTRGTAMALVLAQYGLGFRPVAGKSGEVVLEVDKGNEGSNLWPVGWKTQEATADVVPQWLKSIQFDAEETELNVVVDAIAGKMNIPVFVSTDALSRADRKLESIMYTRKDRVSPYGLLTSIGDKYELGFDVRVDEGGKLFLWTATKADTDAFRKRFAHVRPPKY